jgi:hypothetical protein
VVRKEGRSTMDQIPDIVPAGPRRYNSMAGESWSPPNSGRFRASLLISDPRVDEHGYI